MFVAFRRWPRRHRSRSALGVGIVIVVMAVVGSPPASAQYVPPVDGVVIDTFRPPAHVGAPGNRGWEYATVPGSPVRAVAAGSVAFAGPVAGRSYVSIDHPSGLRTTYGGVAALDVSRGDQVQAGEVIASTTTRFHFGVRRGTVYVDPALLFGLGATAGPPRLIPRPGRVPPRRSNSEVVPLHSSSGPTQDQPGRDPTGTDQSPPQATHGRRVSGVGPRLR